ncbi:hypothetical protein LPB19_01325 [Marinobacter salinisoli]|uniref:Uncharacterized protein n=1 Tax=Marinobacter salinisoli TaxID=2769486 RepID=A0ABX7MRW7_9GAMM|nr:hypothetical protein [Marinobacter salinisoli]QSP95092.1 hypothetical protein LPB19_01325 [Marinobacter salinisoli]
MSEGVKINTSIIVVAFLLFASFFVYMVVNQQVPGSLKVTTKGGNAFELDFSEQEYELTTLIDKVMEDEKRAAIVRATLRENYDLYNVKSTEFVDYLRRLSPQDAVSEEIIGLLVDGAGPFDHQFHTYRNIHTLSAALEIIKLDPKSPAAVRLRDAAVNQEGIFRQIGLPVEIAVVPAARLSDDHASVCSPGKHKYIGHDLVLANKEVAERMVSVYARNPFICFQEGEEVSAPLITINTNTAKKLYGEGDDTGQIKSALMFVVPLGYQVKAIVNDSTTSVSMNFHGVGGDQ